MSTVRDIAQQERFHEFLREQGMKGTTINRVLSVGKAAINRARKRGKIAAAPFVQMVKVNSLVIPPMGRAMSVEKIGCFFAAARHDTLH